MLAFLCRKYLPRQPMHDTFGHCLAFAVAGVWLPTFPSHAYFLQETLALFSNAGPAMINRGSFYCSDALILH